MSRNKDGSWRWYLLLLSTLALGACSEHAALSAVQAEPEESPNGPQTGFFTATGVSGVNYTATSHAGVTGANGEFTYAPGEEVHFTYGSLELGSATGKALVSLFDLAGIPNPPNTPAEFDGQLRTNVGLPGVLHRVVATALVLQSLDTDADATNGIELSAPVAALLTSGRIDLDAPYWDVRVGGNIRDGTGLPGVMREAAAAGVLSARPVRHPGLALQQVLVDLELPLQIWKATRERSDDDADGLIDRTFVRTYGAAGELLSQHYDADGDGLVDRASQFNYSPNLERTSVTHDDGMDGVVDERELQVFDAFGVATRQERTRADGSLISQILLTWDASGRLTRLESNNGSRGWVERWLVDETGMRSVSEVDRDADGTFDRRSTLQFGLLRRGDKWTVREADNDFDGTTDVLHEREFDALGNQLLDRRDDGNDGVLEYERVQTFDSNGLVVTDDIDRDGGGVDSTSLYIRAVDGQLLSHDIDRDGDGTFDWHREFGYDEHDNLTARLTDADNDGLWDERVLWTYEGSRLLQRADDDDADGSADVVERYTYDEMGRNVRWERDDGADGVVDAWTEYSEFVEVSVASQI